MSVERSPLPTLQFTQVEVDQLERPTRFFLQEIPVEPLPTQGIVSMPLAERMSILRDIRQPTSMTPQLQEAFSHSLTGVREDTLQLGAIVLDLQARQSEINYLGRRRKGLQSGYEVQKASIRKGGGGRFAKENKIRAAVSAWKAKDEPLQREESGQEVLRGNAIDNFIVDTFLSEDGVNKFLLAAQDLASQTSIQEGDLVGLVDSATKRLEDPLTPEHTQKFRYKEGRDNFIIEQDAKILQGIAKAAFSNTDSLNPLSSSLKRAAESMLDFYWTNRDKLYGSDERTPGIAFANDLLFSIFITEDFDQITNGMRYVIDKVKGNEGDFVSEYITCLKEGMPERNAIADEIQREKRRYDVIRGTRRSQFIQEADDEYFEQWNPTVRRSFGGKHYDRWEGFVSFTKLASRMLGAIDYAEVWKKKYSSKIDPLLEQVNNEAGRVSLAFEDRLAETFPETQVLGGMISRFIDKETIINAMLSNGYNNIPHLARTREDRQGFVDTILSTLSSASQDRLRSYINRSFLTLLFSSIGVEGYGDFQRLSRENRDLIHRIYNQNLWFVGENGDQFHEDLNPELENNSLQSLTFFPHPESGGHLVEVRSNIRGIDGEELSNRLSINSNGRITLSNGEALKHPVWLKLPLENFILQRLHFVTSGVLGERGPHAGVETGTGGEVIRRHHWRILTSTPDRVYTLTSQSARRHAEFVRDTYGIDIYEENLRRRAEGTLGQNEHMTFVRAVTRDNAEPNQIAFDPTLLAA